MKCADCIAGVIGCENVHVSEWDLRVVEFETVIEQFNIDTRTKQVPHPGFVMQANYCMVCGTKLR